MSIRDIHTLVFAFLAVVFQLSCSAGKQGDASHSDSAASSDVKSAPVNFSADSAYAYVKAQVDFGPRVPGSEAHMACSKWLEEKLKACGAEVSVQTATLTAFDGSSMPMRNIFARLNPEASERVLLLAHWDSRPRADHDPDPAMHSSPIDGANDGASGVGVLLEIARIAAEAGIEKGIDILLCDAEDNGTENNDESWAMGARYFAANLPEKDYMPSAAILLDMVGAPDATFMREYFSQHSNPALADEIWAIAHSLGYADNFPNRMGSAVNDDHLELIKAGIPAIDIIDYREGEGFFSGWHTTADNMQAISKEMLGKVGSVVETYLKK